MKDEAQGLDQEKLAKESNNIVIDILNCLDKRNFIVSMDALSRSIALIMSIAVSSNVIKSSEQEQMIENTIKSCKFYLDYTVSKAKTH